MWHPFKFWRKLGYVYVTGRLAELCDRPDERPKRRTLRAVERAKMADGGYQLGVPSDDWQLVAIEGWAIEPDSSLRSVIDTAGSRPVAGDRTNWPAADTVLWFLARG